MTQEELLRLVAEGGDGQAEFMSAVPTPAVLAERIANFANADGGVIVVGVNEYRDIVGIDVYVLSSSLNTAKTLLSEPLSLRLDTVIIGKHTVAVLHINKSERRIETRPKRRPPSHEEHDSQLSKATPIEGKYSDVHITPCFGVDTLAYAFVDILNQVSNVSDNVCVLGVFGRWGRGKSFFLNRVKRIADSEYFDFVTFNAWKYQEAPGVWANLIHTLQSHKSYLWQIIFCGKLNRWFQYLCEAVLVGLTFYLFHKISGRESVEKALTISGTVLSLLLSVVNLFDIYHSAQSKFGRFDPKRHLGHLHKAEDELKRTLRRWNYGLHPRLHKRKVVLLVEDLDRCEPEKMLSQIESLKLVLEEPEVAQRMIVVISADSDMLKTAYIHKLNKSYTENTDILACEQLNKLFLTGIALPKVSQTDMSYYVDTISDNRNFAGDIKKVDNNVTNIDNVESDHSREEIPHSKLEDKNSIAIISSALKSELNNGLYERLSPRQVKILYYRMLLANNLHEQKGIPVSIAHFKKIIDLSFNFEQASSLDTSIENTVLQIAIPYPLGTPSVLNL